LVYLSTDTGFLEIYFIKLPNKKCLFFIDNL
jgi:hypothetical protein